MYDTFIPHLYRDRVFCF